MPTDDFSGFLSANQPEESGESSVRTHVSSTLEAIFGVKVPTALSSFWRIAGTGYFGDRRLYFQWLPEESKPEPGRRDIESWNGDASWRLLFPEPSRGGPVFFGETCFGDQIGYRLESGREVVILLVIDTCESFVIADDVADLFGAVLRDPFSLVDPARWTRIRAALGPVSESTHYAPIVSPLVGGSESTDNFHVIDATAHLRTAVAEFVALREPTEPRGQSTR